MLNGCAICTNKPTDVIDFVNLCTAASSKTAFDAIDPRSQTWLFFRPGGRYGYRCPDLYPRKS